MPGYEVLPVPQPPENLKVGAAWIDGVGTEGESLVEVQAVEGLSELTMGEASQAKATLTAHFKKWVSGVLSVDAKEVVAFRLEGLKHARLPSLYDTKLKGKVLSEAVTADRLYIQMSDSVSGALSVETVGTAIKKAVAADIQVSAESGGVYVATSSVPLVFAIRVANVKYHQRTVVAPLPVDPSLETMGYRVQTIGAPDPEEQTYELAISNNDIPQYEGAKLVFKVGEPQVITHAKQAIGVSDEQAGSADFVWDKVSLLWSSVPKQVEISRQYLWLEPSESGMETR